MPEAKNNKRQWPVRLAVIITAICLFMVPYLTVTKTTLSSPENTITFLEQSNAFTYTSQIVKNEIETRLPESVQQNLIKRSLVDKLMDLVITPQLLQSISEPIIKLQITLLNRDTKNIQLVNNKVELNIEPYKQNLSSYIASFGLPSGIQETVNDFSGALPNTITIVDGNKNPDSPIITAIKIKNWYNALGQVTAVVWVLLIISILALVALLFRDVHKLFRLNAKTFGVLGALVLVLSYVAPPSLNLLIPNNLTEASGSEISQLISSLNAHFFVLTRTYAWWYIGIAVACALVAWYLGAFGFSFSIEEIKKYFKTKFKRKHS